MDDKTYKSWSERHKWVPEYDRDAAYDWYDSYMEQCYGSNNHDENSLIKLADDASNVIQYLLNDINRENSKRFDRGKPTYLVHVPHTQDCYYEKDIDKGTLYTTDWSYNRIKFFPVNSMTNILFTQAEIKYFGLENCNKTQYLY